MFGITGFTFSILRKVLKQIIILKILFLRIKNHKHHHNSNLIKLNNCKNGKQSNDKVLINRIWKDKCDYFQ